MTAVHPAPALTGSCTVHVAPEIKPCPQLWRQAGSSRPIGHWGADACAQEQNAGAVQHSTRLTPHTFPGTLTRKAWLRRDLGHTLPPVSLGRCKNRPSGRLLRLASPRRRVLTVRCVVLQCDRCQSTTSSLRLACADAATGVAWLGGVCAGRHDVTPHQVRSPG